MITLQEFSQYLAEVFEPDLFKDYCPNGIQVEGQTEIRKLCTGVTASLETIRRAVDSGAQALLVHHGMFWKGDSFAVTGTKREKLRLLMESGISLLAYHLPMDANRDYGNNWKVAHDLGWENLEPFGEFNGQLIGVKGSFAPVNAEEFKQRLETYYEHPAHCALGGKDLISSAALISGGAHRAISEAAIEGVDAFITGSFDEPVWHISHEESVNFFAMGHSASERVGPKAIGEHLAQKFGLEHQFVDVPNPF